MDSPVNSLVSLSVLLMDADGLPKDQCDRRIKQALRRNFEACANSVSASLTELLFAWAAYMWASDLASAEVDVPKELKDEIKKMALVAAFAADAALDSFQMTSRGIAFSVAARLTPGFIVGEQTPQHRLK